MKKNTAERNGMLLCAVIIIAALVIRFNNIKGLAFSLFSSSEEYNTGNAVIDEPVKNLKVDWTSGKVRIESHKENTISISETAKKAIPDDKKMRWRINGDTLEIISEKPGITLFSFSDQEKELTITLPEGITLGDVKIDATSGILEIPSLQADKIHLDITSGEIDAFVQAQTIIGKSTSGDINLQVSKYAEEITVDSTSGRVRIEADEAGKVKINTTSGDVNVKLNSLDTLEIDATSGSIHAALPEKPGFTARIDQTSGHFESSLPLTQKGESYICGNGSGTVKIDVTSGDVRITSSKEQ